MTRHCCPFSPSFSFLIPPSLSLPLSLFLSVCLSFSLSLCLAISHSLVSLSFFLFYNLSMCFILMSLFFLFFNLPKTLVLFIYSPLSLSLVCKHISTCLFAMIYDDAIFFFLSVFVSIFLFYSSYDFTKFPYTKTFR